MHTRQYYYKEMQGSIYFKKQDSGYFKDRGGGDEDVARGWGRWEGSKILILDLREGYDHVCFKITQ